MNILLTSAGRRSYLVQYYKEALEKAGCGGLVHAANSQPGPSFAVADRTAVTPLIYDEAYIPFLLDYCRIWEIRLLIPLFDIDLPVLAAHRDEFLAVGTLVVTADQEAVEICNDKWKTHAFLIQEELPLPKTWLDVELAVQAVKDGRASYPMMVKPRWGMGSLAVYQADDEEELRLLVKKTRRGIEGSYLRYEAAQDSRFCVLIQEKLEGREYGLDVINDLDGCYRTTVVKEKTAMRSGETDEAVTVDNPVLGALGRRLGEKLKHRGNLDVDVFETNGKYYILEMNARFGGGYPFSHVAGVNLPYAMVKWALGQDVEQDCLAARPGVKAQKDIRMLVY